MAGKRDVRHNSGDILGIGSSLPDDPTRRAPGRDFGNEGAPSHASLAPTWQRPAASLAEGA